MEQFGQVSLEFHIVAIRSSQKSLKFSDANADYDSANMFNMLNEPIVM